MNFDWQNLVVLLLVLAAGGYVASLTWQTMARKKAGACGGCGACPASSTAKSPQVFELAALDAGKRPSRDASGHIGS